MKLVLSLVMVFAFQTAIAHDGPHGPELKMAPNGGKLENSTDLSFELLKDESGVKIYSYTHESLQSDKKPLSPTDIKLETKKSSLTNSKKKPVEFKLEPEADYFKVSFKEGGSYYDLKLVVSYKNKEQKPVKWRFEP
jgi:hypothetical protein